MRIKMFRYLYTYLILIFILITSLNTAAESRPFEIKTDAKIVAFGDVHGAYEELISLLKDTGMVDNNLNWSGGNSHLVSMGDLIDRGPRSRDVIDLMMRLQDQAIKSGGEVHVLLGNHELMAMTGNREYTSLNDYNVFAADETDAEREALKLEYIKDHEGRNDKNYSEVFDKSFPKGFIALNRAYGPEGYIGRWLLNQNLILKINDTIFIHGGISSEITGKSLSEVDTEGRSQIKRYINTLLSLRRSSVLPLYVDYNDRVTYLNAKAKKLIDADPDINLNMEKRPAWFNHVLELYEAQNGMVLGNEGPLWYRGTSVCNINCESFNIERFLKRVNARRVVLGHTPTSDHKVIERMDGMVIRLDTGMLKSYYRGETSALIIDKGDIYVHYQGKPEKQPLVKDNFSLSVKLSGMTDSELTDFLATGEIIEKKYIGTGVTKPMKITLKKGDKTINAVFKTIDTRPSSKNDYNESDRYHYDVAAYRLDRMLDLQMVPVAILRKIDGREGVLQYWVENSINERDREEKGIAYDGFCNKNEQYWIRFIFDILIYNEDRNLTNILWTKNDFMMVFIDHTRAFRLFKNRPKQYRKVPLNVSDLLINKLNGLDEEKLINELSQYLNKWQINAILKRRDLILKEAKRTN
jgi:hypothetical protein